MINGVVISQYHDVIYAYDAGNSRITRQEDGGTVLPLIGKVSSLAFVYKDRNDAVTATATDVRKVEIALTLIDIQGNSAVSVSLNSDVNLRNMN